MITRRRAWLVALGATLLLAAGYGVLSWWTTTRLPSGTVISGVPVGGLSREGAVAALQAGLGDQADAQVQAVVGSQTADLSPDDLGLSLDYAGTVEDALTFTLDPRVVGGRLGDGGSSQVRVRVDGTRLDAALADLALSTRVEPVDGVLAITDGQVARVEPVPGTELDVPAARASIVDRWPAQDRLELPTVEVSPQIDTADLDTAQQGFAAAVVAGPITLDVGGRPVQLGPAQVGAMARIEVRDGSLEGTFDPEAVAATLLAPETGLGTTASNARFEFSGGYPVLVPSVDGVSVDPAAATAAVQAALASPDRTASLEAVLVEPAVTTADLQAAGVREPISEFATTLTNNPGRTENIRIAANTVNGTYLAPGQTFSLNDTLGRRTAAKGYNPAPVISGGRLTMGTGGGVSQVATTLFNGMFFAGLQDVRHKPHSFYISRYPEGREATVNYPNIDLRFTNDSAHGVLIQMWLADGQVHTRFWGTKVWEISADKGPRTKVRKPTTIHDSSPGCVSQSPSDGFTVVVTRIFSQGGAEQKRERFTTTYIPEDRVICG
ncbi:MAG: VanW family protein [Actinomycetales bacterium]